MIGEVGRPTDLTEEIQTEIKENILGGFNLKETATNIFNKLDVFKNISIDKKEEELANFIQKLYNWNYANYLNISDKIEQWKRDRKIMLASKNIEAILLMDMNDKDKLKVIQDTSKFVLETLDKDTYSKRSELTGKDGEALIPSNEDREKSNEAINMVLNK